MNIEIFCKYQVSRRGSRISSESLKLGLLLGTCPSLLRNEHTKVPVPFDIYGQAKTQPSVVKCDGELKNSDYNFRL